MDFAMMEKEIMLKEKLERTNKVLEALRSEKYFDEAEMDLFKIEAPELYQSIMGYKDKVIEQLRIC